MKEFVRKPYPENADYEVRSKIDRENAVNGMKNIEENMEEIRAILKVQLDKPGHPYRAVAVEEIIKYLYQNRMNEYEVTKEDEGLSWNYFYARTIYKLVNIIEAVNNKDKEAFNKAMQTLPWGDSNTGDQISWNISRFAYGIMSDEAREEFGEDFAYYIEHSNLSHGDHVNEIKEMGELNFLPTLMQHNAEEAKELEKIKAKKPGQFGE